MTNQTMIDAGRTPSGRTLQYGRRKPTATPAIRFADIRRTGVVIPAHPNAVDYLDLFTNWQMLGNDLYGDCVAVMLDNLVRLISGTLGTEYYGTLADVLACYKTQNPSFDPNDPGGPGDGGMDIQTVLSYWRTHTLFGRKAVAFASVDLTNQDEIDAAIAIFGGLCLGIDVQGSQQTQFAKGQPWNYVAGDPIEGGHGVACGGYSVPTPADDMKFITWADQTGGTASWWKHLGREAWVVILPENLGTKQFQVGISLDALVAAYAAVTNGKVLPIPAPVPVPTPTPTPAGGGCPFFVANALTDLAAQVRMRFAKTDTSAELIALGFEAAARRIQKG